MQEKPEEEAGKNELDGALHGVLRDRFGFGGFRDGQLDIVRAVSKGLDALVVMPTGAGKSLCFQLPALARGGTTLVVSPLLALMKDQVDGLLEKGVRATFINSSISPAERSERMRETIEGRWELVYVAPERFSPQFLEYLQNVDIRLLAIDEAHCISQWGHDFRPDYLRMGHVRRALPGIPTVACTATATPAVQADILQVLGLPDARCFITGFDRENLVLDVVRTQRKSDKIRALLGILQPSPGPGLVYCATRKNVEEVTQVLRDAGVPAGMYHAGLETEERIAVQEGFMDGDFPVVVATNAFGMGVDKDNVRSIVHWGFPGTVEAYYQEIGRAGRDGKESRIVLLYRDMDRRIQEFFINSSYPSMDSIRRVWDRLSQEGEETVFVRLEELARCLEEGSARTAGSCIYVLQRAGYLLRIHSSEREGRVTLSASPPKSPPKGMRGEVYRSICSALGGEGNVLLVRPDLVSARLGISREQLIAALRGLEDRGYLGWEPAERTGGVRLLRLGEPLSIDPSELQRRKRHELEKLAQMQSYARSGCRRRFLLEYFGQEPPWARCGTCDQCRGSSEELKPLSSEQETIVRKLLACMARMGRPFSPGFITKVARGSTESRVRSFGFDRLSTHGLLSDVPESEVLGLLKELSFSGAVAETFVTRTIDGREVTYPECSITDLGWQLMNQELPGFEMRYPSPASPKSAKKKRKSRKARNTPVSDGGLLSRLRSVRSQLGRIHDVPLYVVASNRSLEEMAETQPRSKEALGSVHGMGPKRIKRYGGPFLDAIRTWGE
jgi:ATP-dependent DNA helicase RecQ